ncbi:MAG: energy transducer TonB [Acidobacteriota bacterium]|nr:energy transducer TonB [Acidobacteriota bacterium]
MKPVNVVAPAYPPIAKAARLQGAVISRLEFGSSGNVSKVEIVSGHPLLAKSVETSEGHWTFSTNGNADGCQVLIISEFSLSDSEKANDDKRPWPHDPPGIYRQRIRALFIPPLYTLY